MESVLTWNQFISFFVSGSASHRVPGGKYIHNVPRSRVQCKTKRRPISSHCLLVLHGSRPILLYSEVALQSGSSLDVHRPTVECSTQVEGTSHVHLYGGEAQ